MFEGAGQYESRGSRTVLRGAGVKVHCLLTLKTYLTYYWGVCFIGNVKRMEINDVADKVKDLVSIMEFDKETSLGTYKHKNMTYYLYGGNRD